MNKDLSVSQGESDQARQRFQRCQRLIRPDQFKRVFQYNRRLGDAYFTILGHNTQRKPARLGLAISRKYIKRAVGRNRVKRLIRESFRQHQQQLQGWDIVVMLRRDVSQISNQAIYESLKKHWCAIANSNNK